MENVLYLNKNMYYIYHIPTFVHKNGKIGKIGCTERIDRRALDQGYQDFEILEEHTCMREASRREIELQKQYNYPVDKVPYWKTRESFNSEVLKLAGTIGGKKAGKITGRKHVESGHILQAAQKAWESTSIPIVIDGITYKSIQDAYRSTNLSHYKIKKLRKLS